MPNFVLAQWHSELNSIFLRWDIFLFKTHEQAIKWWGVLMRSSYFRSKYIWQNHSLKPRLKFRNLLIHSIRAFWDFTVDALCESAHQDPAIRGAPPAMRGSLPQGKLPGSPLLVHLTPLCAVVVTSSWQGRFFIDLFFP